MPVAMSAMTARIAPKNALAAWGRRILALGVRPPLIKMANATVSSRQHPAMTKTTEATMPRIRSVLETQRSTFGDYALISSLTIPYRIFR